MPTFAKNTKPKTMMRIITTICLLLCLFSRCTDDMQQPDNQIGGRDNNHLTISTITTHNSTKALIECDYLPNGSEIGITVLNTEGTAYDNIDYQNIRFEAESTGVTQKWQGDETIYLSATEGYCYGYYPYSLTANDITQIPVSTASQTDYLYATPKQVDINNKNVNLNMKHALSAIRLALKRGTYTGTGKITAVSVTSTGLGTTGTLNATTGKVTANGTGTVIAVTTNIDLTTTEQNADIIVVPTGNEATLTLTATIDGKAYMTPASAITIEQGKCYTYTVTINAGELALSGIKVGDWGYDDGGTPTIEAAGYKVTFAGDYSDIAFSNTVTDGTVTIKACAMTEGKKPKKVEVSSGTFSQSVDGSIRTITLSNITSNVTVTFDGTFSWQELSDGIYAIDNEGFAVDYNTAITAETGTYQGVAVSMKGKTFEVATSEASVGTKWAETYPMSETEAAFFSSYYIGVATPIVVGGFLKMPNGAYYSSSTEDNRISDDIYTWTWGSLSDLNGKTNTDRILISNVTIASVVRAYNDGSHDSSNWYLPAPGQLAYIFMNYDKINELMAKVGGTAMSTSERYWASRLPSEYCAWAVYFDSGRVNGDGVNETHRARLVRDL